MKIVVLSCDKNADTFEAFHHCMEKYWPGHPEIIYKTETIQNPYYKTIAIPCELSEWTRGIRQFLNQIDSDIVLSMMDDCFLRDYVDVNRLYYAESQLLGNIACFNLEKSFDKSDEITDIQGFKKRRHGSSWEVSLMCGLWNKEKLIKILSVDSSPWDIETVSNNYGFDFYINADSLILNWGHHQIGDKWSIYRGKWCREVVSFFAREGIEIDYSKRGFYD